MILCQCQKLLHNLYLTQDISFLFSFFHSFFFSLLPPHPYNTIFLLLTLFHHFFASDSTHPIYYFRDIFCRKKHQIFQFSFSSQHITVEKKPLHLLSRKKTTGKSTNSALEEAMSFHFTIGKRSQKKIVCSSKQCHLNAFQRSCLQPLKIVQIHQAFAMRCLGWGEGKLLFFADLQSVIYRVQWTEDGTKTG